MFVRFGEVRFVEHEEFWFVDGAHEFVDDFFFIPNMAGWVNNVQDNVDVFQTRTCGVVEFFGENVRDLGKNTWGVDENDLTAFIMNNTLQGVAGGLWFGGGNGDFGADEGVQKGGFTHVRASHKNREADFFDFWC